MRAVISEPPIPRYVLLAREEMGVCEVPGEANSTRVLEYLRTVLKSRLPKFLRDETAWCSAFVNWCVTRAGFAGTGKPNARSWLTWGSAVPLERPLYGCVCVLKRGTLPWQGHVGFLVGWDAHSVTLLGGNQGNRVCEQKYPRSRVLGFRTHLVS